LHIADSFIYSQQNTIVGQRQGTAQPSYSKGKFSIFTSCVIITEFYVAATIEKSLHYSKTSKANYTSILQILNRAQVSTHHVMFHEPNRECGSANLVGEDIKKSN
jgi:hypothetical protein